MKAILVVLLCFSCTVLNAQLYSLGYYEKYFKNVAQSLTLTRDGVVFTSSQLESLADSLYTQIYTRPYPNWKVNYYGFQYLHDKAFKRLVDFIDSLPPDASAFDESIEMLKVKSQNELTPVSRLKLRIHLIFHFSRTKDQALQKKIGFYIKDFYPDSLSITERDADVLLETMGDFFTKMGKIDYGLEFYCEAKYYMNRRFPSFRLAQIEAKIAKLYLIRGSISNYRNRAIQHYRSAAKHHSRGVTNSYSLNDDLKAAAIEVWDKTYVQMKDIISFSIANKYKRDEPDIANIVGDDKFFEKQRFILDVAYKAMNSRFEDKPLDYDFNLYSLLASYFQKIGDWETAKVYLSLMQIYSLSRPDFEIANTVHSLSSFAWLYSNLNDWSRANNYIDKAIKLSFWSGNDYTHSQMRFTKSLFLTRAGRWQEALAYARATISSVDTIFTFQKDDLYDFGFECLKEIYCDIGLTDSSVYYNEQYLLSKDEYLQEIQLLNETELNHIDEMNSKKLEKIQEKLLKSEDSLLDLNKILLGVMTKVDEMRGEINKKRDSLTLLGNEMHNLLFKNDSLYITNVSKQRISDSLAIVVANANGEIQELQKIALDLAKNNRNAVRAKQLAWLFVGLAIAFGGIAIFMSYIRLQRNKKEAKRLERENIENNYKLKLEKNMIEMKLLSTLAVDHDISKFIPLLPGYIGQITEETKSSLQKIAEDFKSYYELTKNTGTLTNLVKDEVQIAQKSGNVYLYIYKSKTKCFITTNFEDNTEIENLEIPKNMITSFVANSIKHGSVGKSQIEIQISARKEADGYSFAIQDNGTGFSSLGLDAKNDDKGINLILQQVKNHNEGNSNTGIEFNPSNVVSLGIDRGTLVTFKLKKK